MHVNEKYFMTCIKQFRLAANTSQSLDVNVVLYCPSLNIVYIILININRVLFDHLLLVDINYDYVYLYTYLFV